MATRKGSAAAERYSALLLFQFRVVSARTGAANRRRLCEKRLIVLEATSPREALQQAKRRGREAEHDYLNADGDRVYFEFVGVMDLLSLGLECDPDEVWYDFARLLEPMERRRRWCPPEAELRAGRRGGVVDDPLR
jgi:hypothetical protein